MAKRTANAVWEGTLREGKGTVKLGSGTFEGQYSFAYDLKKARARIRKS